MAGEETTIHPTIVSLVPRVDSPPRVLGTTFSKITAMIGTRDQHVEIHP